MTWLKISTKMMGMVILLPLAMKYLSLEEFIIWQVFISINFILTMIDFGLTPTIARYVAYGMGGIEFSAIQYSKIENNQFNGDVNPNWETIRFIRSIMQYVYRRIFCVAIIIGIIIGSSLIYGIIEKNNGDLNVWIAWGVTILTGSLQLFNNYYRSLLMGVNKIGELELIQFLTILLSLLLSIIFLVQGFNLLILVIAYQSNAILNFIILHIYSNKVYDSKIHLKYQKFSISDKKFIRIIWSASWRSGLGIIMCTGLIQLSGIVFANIGNTLEVASYLLALQIIRVVSTFSQVPFYTKIPKMAQYFAQGKKTKVIKIAKKYMQSSYIIFSVCVLFGLFFGENLLKLLNSEVAFPDSKLWSILSMGILVERFGAMHLQLYSLTNHIIWHIVTVVSGIIMIAISYFLYPLYGVLAFPIAILIGYLSFYSWYSAQKVYRTFNLNPISFESTTFIPALVVIILGIIVKNTTISF